MGAPRFVLLHSPLLGPASLAPLAATLAERGDVVQAPAWPKLSTIGDGYYEALVQAMAANIDGAGAEPVLLVAHSGAGALIPALAHRLRSPLAGVIFVDAGLPHPGRSWLDAGPPDAREALRGGAQMGQLPPWDDWWPPGALSKLVPDAAVLGPVIAELEPLPLAYFEEAAPPEELADVGAPCGYLQLSTGYADEARIAGRLGWQNISLPLNHLGPLSHPKAVAAVVQTLAAGLAEPAHG
jgi:hypothetical protein